MQWLSWNMYCVGLCNDWAEICIAFEYAMIQLKYVYAFKYAMIELKYVLRWNMQWLNWNVYCVGIGNDWVEIYIALELAMIELKYV